MNFRTGSKVQKLYKTKHSSINAVVTFSRSIVKSDFQIGVVKSYTTYIMCKKKDFFRLPPDKKSGSNYFSNFPSRMTLDEKFSLKTHHNDSFVTLSDDVIVTFYHHF